MLGSLNRIMAISVLLFLAHGLFPGCRSGTRRVDGGLRYDPPRNRPDFETSISVPLPKSEAWSRLLLWLGKHSFVVTNIDGDAGFLSASYTGDPQAYVDGGILHYWVNEGLDRRDYTFPAARAYERFELVQRRLPLDATRTLELKGRVNIVVFSKSPAQTTVTVTARYILTKTLTTDLSVRRSADAEVVRLLRELSGLPATNVETASFDTNQQGTFGLGGAVFLSTGRLERDVLSSLK